MPPCWWHCANICDVTTVLVWLCIYDWTWIKIDIQERKKKWNFMYNVNGELFSCDIFWHSFMAKFAQTFTVGFLKLLLLTQSTLLFGETSPLNDASNSSYAFYVPEMCSLDNLILFGLSFNIYIMHVYKDYAQLRGKSTQKAKCAVLHITFSIKSDYMATCGFMFTHICCLWEFCCRFLFIFLASALKTLFNIVDSPFNFVLNFDVCVVWWCSDGPINSHAGIQKFWHLCGHYQDIYDWISPLTKRLGLPVILTQQSMGRNEWDKSGHLSIFTSFKHLMVLFGAIFFRASFYTLSKTLIACRNMQLNFLKVKTLLNNAFNVLV